MSNKSKQIKSSLILSIKIQPSVDQYRQVPRYDRIISVRSKQVFTSSHTSKQRFAVPGLKRTSTDEIFKILTSQKIRVQKFKQAVTSQYRENLEKSREDQTHLEESGKIQTSFQRYLHSFLVFY